MTIDVRLEVNGRATSHPVEPRTSLADLLRGACALTGTHLGCEHGVCGACTVMIDGAPARSCITYAAQADGSRVETIEGFDDDPLMGELRDAFRRHHALQCGFCTPGMLITARDIVRRLPRLDESRVREELGGNLCRCTGYVGIVAAVMEVAARPHAEPAPAPRETLPPAPHSPAPTVISSASFDDAPHAVTIQESVALAHPPAKVWAALADLERLARCLPGAEITAIEGERVRGRLRIRMGPIASHFEIDGVQSRDDAKRAGKVSGQGRDTLTGSRARGRIEFAVGDVAGTGSSRLDVQLGFSVQGMLAQFSRGALMQDLARQLLAQFAANLSAQLDGRPAAQSQAAEMRSGSLLLGALRRWLARLFGGR